MGVITKTPESKDVKLINLGEASFAGPAQRIVMFHCDDRVHFYRYDESKDFVRLKWFKWFNFELKNRGFVKPILTWGETYTQPVCFATNVDGDGRIFYSSYQENLSIEANTDRPASVVNETDAAEGPREAKVLLT
ncbi:hypothetical protein SCHPADRAFT_620193 [Schizopora paradoxa]|uniref:Uncharacterized protein n=1 Tax=Schizopora paradoxa TaxID=27342 RepID=A0A0H2R8H1_9AGAM|nr:hypothetical protein SCHPADRAFT_620193 [Schizopora paradoxa]